MMEKRLELIESYDCYTIHLDGFEVEGVVVDHDVTLRLASALGQMLIIRLEEPFSWKQDQKSITLSADDPSALPIISSLGHKETRSVTIWKNGDLEIELSNAGLISVRPNGLYEAWELSEPNGLRIVCMPGGELAIWR